MLAVVWVILRHSTLLALLQLKKWCRALIVSSGSRECFYSEIVLLCAPTCQPKTAAAILFSNKPTDEEYTVPFRLSHWHCKRNIAKTKRAKNNFGFQFA